MESEGGLYQCAPDLFYGILLLNEAWLLDKGLPRTEITLPAAVHFHTINELYKNLSFFFPFGRSSFVTWTGT
jgi:hypothetical protein